MTTINCFRLCVPFHKRRIHRKYLYHVFYLVFISASLQFWKLGVTIVISVVYCTISIQSSLSIPLSGHFGHSVILTVIHAFTNLLSAHPCCSGGTRLMYRVLEGCQHCFRYKSYTLWPCLLYIMAEPLFLLWKKSSNDVEL